MLHHLHRLLKTIPPTVGFAAILIALFTLTYQFSAVFMDPQGIHFIRQSDSLAFASNYYHFGYGLFEPHTFSLASTNGAAACEFPLLYFITALIYQFSGETFSILRIIHLTIISFGFLAAFRFSYRRVEHFTIAATLTLLLITSTVVLYYASNFLVDSAALGFTLMGLERFDRYRISERPFDFGVTIFLFTFAALLKITFALWPLALFGALFSFQKPYIRSKDFALLIPVVLSSAWFGFAEAYNHQSGDNYFLTTSIPLWQLKSTEARQLIDAVTHYWIGSYYPPVTRWAFVAAFVFSLWNIKRIPRFELRLLGIAALGIGCYCLLMGRAFINHDYYFLPLVPWVLLLFAIVGEAIRSIQQKMKTLVVSLLLVAICGASVVYVREKLERRYYASNDPFDDATLSLRTDLSKHDLPMPEQNSTVIVVGDPTRNGSLCYLKSKGMTYPDLSHFSSILDNGKLLPEATLLYINEPLPEEWSKRISATLRAQGSEWRCYTLNR